MSFLLDTNTCSAHIKRPSGLAHRFAQYSGNLYVPTIVLGELYAWAFLKPNPTLLLQGIQTLLLPDTLVIDFDHDCAVAFGQLRGYLQKSGITVTAVDQMIAAVALVHNLTLVTNNTGDFKNIPNLRLDDWLVP